MQDEGMVWKPTFREFLIANLEAEDIEGIVEHGVDAGWPCLTYYRDTTAVYDRYADELWEMLGETADETGHSNRLELIASFGGAANVNTDDQFKCLIVWYAAEEVARAVEAEQEEGA